MTDGILLKEIENDFLLKKYSIIIIDEAHERSLNSDILIGLLTKIASLRLKLSKDERKQETSTPDYFPLRLLVMSATLKVSDFTDNPRLFQEITEPQVVNVQARQFPVTIHYSKVTKDNYVDEAFKKVCKIHKDLPSGGILIFLTGKKEIQFLCRRLEAELGNKKRRSSMADESEEEDKEVEDESDNEEELSHEPEDLKERGTQDLKVKILPLFS